MYTLKKGVMVLAVVFIMLLSGFFGRSLMYVLRQMNSLSDDHIDAGHYLTIRYYK